jgi:hypothetical protein
MKYLLAITILLSFSCSDSWEEVKAQQEAESKAEVTEIARTIALERYGSFTTVVCYVEYRRSTYTGYTDGQGDLQYFYPCLVFAPEVGGKMTRERGTFTMYCSDKSCQRE